MKVEELKGLLEELENVVKYEIGQSGDRYILEVLMRDGDTAYRRYYQFITDDQGEILWLGTKPPFLQPETQPTQTFLDQARSAVLDLGTLAIITVTQLGDDAAVVSAYVDNGDGTVSPAKFLVVRKSDGTLDVKRVRV